MFLVQLNRSSDRNYHPLTINAAEYLYDFAKFIARSVPDAEVHATLGLQMGDEVVFLGKSLEDVGIELF